MTRKMFVVAILLLVGVTALVAQQMRMTPQEATDRLTKDLELTKEQQPKVLDVLVKTDQARQKAMQAAEGDREAARPAIMKIRDEANAKMKEILTKDQWTKYEKMQAERRSQGGPGGPGGPPQQPPPQQPPK